ncbi:PcfJ domain-containing protein [Massilia sp. HP4]|uniref:PcfJ domain-containing protein n=1 Tax=Massilia sp. HP4 TaxID=2562316 RepID=UPI0010C0A1F8|nr:PcfJ domain-containing protein [Massilia sp. HP4]
MQWVGCDAGQGPLAFLLMHVTADPRGVLSGASDCRALASVRCVLRSGMVYALGMRGPRNALPDACRVLAAALPQLGYDESRFSHLERDIAAALQAAGYAAVQATLERNATLLAQPAMTAAQVDWLISSIGARRGDDHAQHHGDADGDRVVAAYLEHLDDQARDYMADARTVCGQPVDRLAVYNFIVGQGGRSCYRVQALRLLPWLLPLLAAPDRGRLRRDIAAVARAIDGAEPLHDAVARAFDVPREVVRWLGTRALPAHWQLDDVRLPKLLAALSWLAPERRPRSPAQFDDLMQLCGVLAAVFRFRDSFGDLRMRAWSELHGPCMRRWLAECRQPGWAQDAMRRDGRGFAAECADASDFLRALVDAVEYRQDAGDRAALAVVARWAAGIGLRRMLALSRRWHAEAFGAGGALADEPGVVEQLEVADWPAILPEPMHFGGIVVVELASATQLRAEGMLMQHCVASYAGACHSGQSAIVSLRAASGVVLSTAELRLVDGDCPRVAVEQHRSTRNGAPNAECERALEALVPRLNGEAAAALLQARIRFQQDQRGRARPLRQAREGHAHRVALRLAGSLLEDMTTPA